jgi:hypothetical protein
MFKIYCTYSHRNSLDVNILVLKKYKIYDGRYKLTVAWIYKNGKPLGITEKIIITKDQVKNWNEVCLNS